MSVLRFFTRRSSAPAARERLQLLLAHERAVFGRTDLVAQLKDEILAVIAKHIAIDPDKVRIKTDTQDTLATLEVDIEIRTPNGGLKLAG
ncbi:cell division topological specificity factor MinE [Methylopila musalis]|uniref:Cell division topological specificity factor n=2 Tax=Methylopila TaxID=61653 RepID=A0A9W6JET9_9HYPH|nr:cell division topological specificity factor MinE [Methylopila jiangsuensis]MDR6284191.1 cell division topological specificity factor [Methylopila jiangsuensis]GLK76291.1 cell division topological specificity factor [Methylopila jiangsuensis]